MLASLASTCWQQVPELLVPCSIAGLSLLRAGRLHAWHCRSTSSSTSSSNTCLQADSGHGLQHAGGVLPGQFHSCLHCLVGSQSSHPAATSLQAGAGMHHAAVADFAGSDEESTAPSTSTSGSSSGGSGQQAHRSSLSWLDQQRQQRQQQLQQQRHQQQHVGQLHHMAGHHQQQSPLQQQQQQQQPRYQGHLHAPHGRRHATSRSQLDKFISDQLLSCKSLGMLRRIMIKHKATMEPEHVADTLLCLQHIVRTARAARRHGPHGAPFSHRAHSQARSQPRVRAAGELSRSKERASESDGHMEQLMAQMLGDLGSMIWFMMGDMTGPDLAKLLYSWAALEWHPEPELLADVQASFLAAAAGGGLQQQNQQAAYAGQQQWAELQVWQGPWMAAGLWGLAQLAEGCQGGVLQLLRQHWRQLLPYWTPQQLADIAYALTHTASAVSAGGADAANTPELLQQQQQQELVDMVSGLARQALAVLGPQLRQQGDDGEVPVPQVPMPWPESMLIQLQASLWGAPAAAAAAQRAAAATSDIAAAELSSGGSAAIAGEGGPMMAVHNAAQLCWRLLGALKAVGVNSDVSSSEQEGVETKALAAELYAAAKAASLPAAKARGGFSSMERPL